VAGWVRSTILGMALAGMTWAACGMAAQAQLPMPGTQPETPNPLTDTTETPGQALLYKLEADFEAAGLVLADHVIHPWDPSTEPPLCRGASAAGIRLCPRAGAGFGPAWPR